ncbi:predicted protein [Histoplasma capsulatum G186AR]|uniref:Uncharacterized protein n=1 Tax=Ajellomyces capsulatus (strain G186AR / H82 / ATCC MYA-2454 / RMSCC 2432) TaxID=447093 RepID=C0NK63_AJECG|nr:uncharacterized protein HCBG_03543 [Histoplasma capsulatum G186AR]EEH08254.1 predicted protein [Histoplasma capsulatum G186AR]
MAQNYFLHLECIAKRLDQRLELLKSPLLKKESVVAIGLFVYYVEATATWYNIIRSPRVDYLSRDTGLHLIVVYDVQTTSTHANIQITSYDGINPEITGRQRISNTFPGIGCIPNHQRRRYLRWNRDFCNMVHCNPNNDDENGRTARKDSDDIRNQSQMESSSPIRQSPTRPTEFR